jgi:hypothetical protein
MLTLEAVMLTVFGEEGQKTMVSVMTTATGAAVIMLILTMSVYMIVSANKKIRRISNHDGKQ